MILKKCYGFFKKETVLCIAILLALVSMLWVHPDRAYTDYIDVRTLAILFCLMAVVAGMSRIGVFDWLAQKLLSGAKDMRQIILLLVLLCFFFGMLITNDVALVTFVPLAIIVLKQTQSSRLLIPVVTLQTIAANLGSMMTPVGNPQNLYLYGQAGLGMGEFVGLMLPYGGAALALIVAWALTLAARDRRKNGGKGTLSAAERTGKGEPSAAEKTGKGEPSGVTQRGRLMLYLLLFALCLLVVAHVLPYPIVFAVVLAVCLAVDRGALRQVDYALLGTFVGFFVFVGNLGRLDAFCGFLRSVMDGHEVLTAVVSSQVMSNVPAALLLSGFTERYGRLIVGVNLGGLGTLIASMASLISFKYLAKEAPGLRGRYLGYFTFASIVFLALELVLCACCGML